MGCWCIDQQDTQFVKNKYGKILAIHAHTPSNGITLSISPLLVFSKQLSMLTSLMTVVQFVIMDKYFVTSTWKNDELLIKLLKGQKTVVLKKDYKTRNITIYNPSNQQQPRLGHIALQDCENGFAMCFVGKLTIDKLTNLQTYLSLHQYTPFYVRAFEGAVKD